MGLSSRIWDGQGQLSPAIMSSGANHGAPCKARNTFAGSGVPNSRRHISGATPGWRSNSRKSLTPAHSRLCRAGQDRIAGSNADISLIT